MNAAANVGAVRRDWDRPGYDTEQSSVGAIALLKEALRHMEQFGTPDVQAHRLVSKALQLIRAPDTRSCTCHPDDHPPRPCPRKFAFSECVAAPGVALPLKRGA